MKRHHLSPGNYVGASGLKATEVNLKGKELNGEIMLN